MRRFMATMPRASDRAVYRGLNRAIRQARTFGSREVAEARNIKVGRAKEDMRVKLANPSQMEAAVIASGQPIPVMEVKGAKTQTKAGVKATIAKGNRHLFKGAFIAKMASGHVGVFKRAGKKRRMRKGNYIGQSKQPIVEQVLPSVPATMVQEGTERKMRAKAIPVYEKELIRLLDLEMKKAGAR